MLIKMFTRKLTSPNSIDLQSEECCFDAGLFADGRESLLCMFETRNSPRLVNVMTVELMYRSYQCSVTVYNPLLRIIFTKSCILRVFALTRSRLYLFQRQ